MNKKKRKQKRDRTKAWKKANRSPEWLLKYVPGTFQTFDPNFELKQQIALLAKNIDALNNEVAQIKVAIKILKRTSK